MKKKAVQARSKQTVEFIFKALSDLMLLSDLETITINDISKKSGVSIGSIYQYFSSKEDLVGEFYRSHLMNEFEILRICLKKCTSKDEVMSCFFQCRLKIARLTPTFFSVAHRECQIGMIEFEDLCLSLLKQKLGIHGMTPFLLYHSVSGIADATHRRKLKYEWKDLCDFMAFS